MSAAPPPTPPTPEDERTREELERLAEQLAAYLTDVQVSWGEDGWTVTFTVLADPADPDRDPGWDEETDNATAAPPTVTRRLGVNAARAYLRGCEDMLIHMAWGSARQRAQADPATVPAAPGTDLASADERDNTAPVPHTWDGEPFAMRSIPARTKEASRWLHTYLQAPDRAASPNQDLRRLERFTLLSFSVRLAIYHLILRLHAVGAGDQQVAAAAGMKQPELTEARTAVVNELGDITNFTDWTKRITRD